MTDSPTLAAMLEDDEGWAVDLSDDGVLHLQFANPPVNAIRTAMFQQLNAAVASVRNDDSVRAIVLTADHPKVFSAGIDFKELLDGDEGVYGAPGDRRTFVRHALEAWYTAPVPTVVGVKGSAFGAGVVLPCLADLVVGGPGTVFTASEIDRGIVGGSRFFARLVGEPLMRKMILLGLSVTGEELDRAGAFAEYVEDDAVNETALALGHRLAEKHPVAMRLMKQANTEVEYLPVMEGYAVEQKWSVAVPPEVREELVPKKKG
jgi:enoyl-CoA hydratase